MKLTRRVAKTLEAYDSRDALFRLCDDEGLLVRWYLIKEPHTFLHVGHLARFFNRHGITEKGGSVISVGLDIFKELFIADLTGQSFIVIDRDARSVATLNQLKALHSWPLSYVAGDVTDPGMTLLANHPCSTMLLSQMDYILTDEQIMSTVRRAAENPALKRIVVLSPSLFSIASGRPMATMLGAIREATRFVEFLIAMKRQTTLAVADSYPTFVRSLGRLDRLMGREWVRVDTERYDYPSGKMHLLLFERAQTAGESGYGDSAPSQ